MAITGFLKKIYQVRTDAIAKQRAHIPLTAVRHDAEYQAEPPDFLAPLQGSTATDVGIIAEIKKASPSRGDIRPDLDVAGWVDQYTRAGAAAVSVLTEPRYFKGSLDDLETACTATDLPVLCKDFIISDYQIYGAKAAGASAVLLITALLSPGQQADYTALARELSMDVLVEIRSEWEFEQAYTTGATVVGINNRNLETLETDPAIAPRVVKILPPEIIPVAASGIDSRSRIEQGITEKIYNFLVGETIVRAADPMACIQALKGQPA